VLWILRAKVLVYIHVTTINELHYDEIDIYIRRNDFSIGTTGRFYI
jgi:hypothetical protein